MGMRDLPLRYIKPRSPDLTIYCNNFSNLDRMGPFYRDTLNEGDNRPSANKVYEYSRGFSSFRGGIVQSNLVTTLPNDPHKHKENGMYGKYFRGA
jgi:hypothetical protein